MRRAVNIAFAGDFSGDSMPTPDQMAAGGRLTAWLLQRYPHLSFDSVKGLSEFTATLSPGGQWQSGRVWKQLLLTSARRASGVVENTATENALRDRVSELEQRLRLVEQERLGLEEQRLELTEEQRRLEAEIASKPAIVASFVVPKPSLQVVVDQLPKHPVLRYDRRPLSQITHIAVHHTAAPSRLGPARIAELHIAADSGRGKEAWPGIGYHFFVHEDGSIEQTNYLETASFHVFRHYSYSVGVVFAGSFMNGKIPSSAQLRSGAHLVAWLMQELNVPLARVWGHREFPDNMTVCPGGEWTQGNRWRDLLFERIREIQQGAGLKTTRHYMLFAQGSDGSPVGREEFVNALGYMTRFRPTVGFSIEEARNAEFVTIVGGEAGISAAEEQMLAQTGGRVERIAGRDASETDRLLAELVRVGRRFRSFEVDF